MLIYLYTNKDSNNVINKTLENEIEKDITLKDRVNIMNPIIRLKDSTPIDNNYCYIPNFNRYYFIEEVIFVNKEIQEIYLSCDVLETYKDDILNSESIISKSEQDNNLSMGRLSKENAVIDIYKGEPVNYKDNIILVTIK